jgi:hypothetical protein
LFVFIGLLRRLLLLLSRLALTTLLPGLRSADAGAPQQKCRERPRAHPGIPFACHAHFSLFQI